MQSANFKGSFVFLYVVHAGASEAKLELKARSRSPRGSWTKFW